jgi:hypothetical protein
MMMIETCCIILHKSPVHSYYCIDHVSYQDECLSIVVVHGYRRRKSRQDAT